MGPALPRGGVLMLSFAQLLLCGAGRIGGTQKSKSLVESDSERTKRVAMLTAAILMYPDTETLLEKLKAAMEAETS